MRNYHVTMSNGTERNVKAKNMEVTPNGSLTFDNDGEVICAYAAGAWSTVEVERLDDKG